MNDHPTVGMLVQKQRDTSVARETEILRAIVELPLPEDLEWERDSAVIHAFTTANDDSVTQWVETHALDDILSMINRARDVSREHHRRAEQAGETAAALRSILEDASTGRQHHDRRARP